MKVNNKYYFKFIKNGNFYLKKYFYILFYTFNEFFYHFLYNYRINKIILNKNIKCFIFRFLKYKKF